MILFNVDTNLFSFFSINLNENFVSSFFLRLNNNGVCEKLDFVLFFVVLKFIKKDKPGITVNQKQEKRNKEKNSFWSQPHL